ncbi:hypothetical protein [Sphingomonas crocodyli]|uniref:Uncharacterized protein n=1 Tax=Sphingomonas crocodyli TaxID=1979270 RepID=A0A437LZW0_9SPHN|nr:hypothetical protein [Sphingomonas crocodyli]RVT90968.1 hypothetical protein EOD43_15660 [Sphingomonas crocodyli]
MTEEPLYMPSGEASLWQAVLALAQELSVARDRIDLLERGLAAKEVFAAGELERLPLDDDAVAIRAAARKALVDRVIQPLSRP